MTNPWEDTELPEPVDPMYVCPGLVGWHSEAFYFDCYLQWMQGESGTHHPHDDYYCSGCIYKAKQDAERGLRAEVILRPALEDEIKRRRRSGLKAR